MNEEEIRSILVDGLRKIAPESDPAALDPDVGVRAALDIDSFDFLNFLIGLHRRIGIEIPESDYGKLGTLRAMIDYLKVKLG